MIPGARGSRVRITCFTDLLVNQSREDTVIEVAGHIKSSVLLPLSHSRDH